MSSATPKSGLKVNYVHRREPLAGEIREALITRVAPDQTVTLIADTRGGEATLGKSWTTAGVPFSTTPQPHTWHHIK